MSITIKDVQDLVDEYADQGYAQGYEAAEARIIKLLDERLTTVLFDELVALIKEAK